ncbi:lipase 3-like [Nasonia vitripennis]|uniref:Partial AB-hydrolase lipase domain-containing protein n=1 Tax=Nasonia vitripennis TaxID=7425 RepID=A0A7M7PTS5_NASVI|nr:lipase 3-like [Nasonia vitripennis]
MIRKQGYIAEEHLILTEDGYLLTLHRIPGSTGSPIVLLEHGLLLSSFDYTANGKDEALAFFLADKGYDVWMGNLRGNIYSRCHIKYLTTDNRFWNFSFHEMGIYDLPAQIKYITDMKNDDIVYVGHSMGTTTFYVMAIERPDIASKIKAMFGLAPVAFVNHIKGVTAILVPLASFFNKFRYFDYGKKGNRIMYNSSAVPEYEVTKIKVPIGIFYSDNDFLATPEDARDFYKLMPYKILAYKVPDPNFSHFDFVWGMNAKNVVYKKLLSVMKDYQ